MSYHNHLVSMPYQSLRQGIDVILHSPKARVKEVTNERNAVRHYMYYYVVLVVSVEACGVGASSSRSSEGIEQSSRKNSGRFTYVLYVRTFSFRSFA